MKNNLIIWASLFFGLLIHTNLNAEQAEDVKPVVYSYWAGWSNGKVPPEEVPDIKFDGLFLAFAELHLDSAGNYYTDYKASGDFQIPSDKGAYSIWSKWWIKYWNQGSRAYISYGGGANTEFRSMVINATDQQLDQIAGEIKANIGNDKLKFYFDGVDLDIENWWGFNQTDNERFAFNLAKLIKILRKSLDNDPKTKGKAIMLAVGLEAAGRIDQMISNGNASNSDYAGTMMPVFSDSDAMNAVSAINIMTYNTKIPDFYSRLDLFDAIFNQFRAVGIPQQKLIMGIQPCEFAGAKATSPETVNQLALHSKEQGYGGLFFWVLEREVVVDNLLQTFILRQCWLRIPLDNYIGGRVGIVTFLFINTPIRSG